MCVITAVNPWLAVSPTWMYYHLTSSDVLVVRVRVRVRC